jgi:hypothetical protein
MGKNVRAALAVVLLACPALACRQEAEPEEWRCLAAVPPPPRPRPAGEFAFARWEPPVHREVQLAEQPGSVEGKAAPQAGVLASFEGDAVAAFVPEPLTDEPGVRLRGPALDPPLAGATRLRIRLRPGGATRVRVIPFGTGMSDERMQRSHRGVEVALDRDAAPDRPVDLVSRWPRCCAATGPEPPRDPISSGSSSSCRARPLEARGSSAS